MSTTIDNRVVQMTFDNEQFEEKAQTSLTTLQKLEKALKFDKASEGLKGISSAADKVSFSGMEEGVLQVQNRFSSLQAIAFTALQNITNTAINAGKNIVNSLAIDPITTGFQEYETQINAVQTILSNTRSKGTTITDVNRALDELNTYADKTIYNFTEMTRNIGTFTAAGVDLQTATKSIQGIANLAAVSGSTSQQASTAMYQLSQALAAGTVKLQDWNSVVNAGMGGEVFQNALKRTASVMGTDVDAMIEKYGSFRESLTKGEWLTTEVLTETLNQFANVYSKADLIKKGYSEDQANEIVALGQDAENAATKVKTLTQLWDTLTEAAQSGWTSSWEILVGDFYQARTVLTEISDAIGGIINAQSEARNTLLQQAFGKHVTDVSKWESTVSKLGADSEKGLQRTMARSAEMYGINLNAMTKDTGSFKEALKEGWLDAEVLEGALRFNKSLDKVAKTEKEASANSKALSDAVSKNLDKKFKTGEERLAALNKAGFSSASVLSQLSEDLRKNGASLSYWSDDVLASSGYTEDQIKAFHELIDVTTKADDPLTQLILDLERPTGRDMLIESAKNILTVMAKTLGAVGKAYHKVFGTIDGFGVYEAIKNFRDLTSTFTLNEKAANNITKSFVPLFAALRVGVTAVSMVLRLFGSLFILALKLSGVVLRLVYDFAVFVGSIFDVVRSSDRFNAFLSAIYGLFSRLRDAIIDVKNSFADFAKSIGDIPGVSKLLSVLAGIGSAIGNFALDKLIKITDAITAFINSISFKGLSLDGFGSFIDNTSSKLADFLSGFSLKDSKGTGISKFASDAKVDGSKLDDAARHLKNAKDNLFDVLGDFKDKLIEYAKMINFERLIALIKTGALVAFITKLTGILNSIKKLFDRSSKLSDKMKDVLDEVSDTLEAYQTQIKADAIFTIAKAIAVIAASLLVLSIVPSDKLAAVTVDLAVLLLIVALILKIGTQLGKGAESVEEGAASFQESISNLITGFKDAVTKSLKVAAFGAFAIMLSIAVAILAKTILDLADIPVLDALKAVGIIMVIVTMIVAASVILNRYAKNLDAGMGAALIGLGLSIKLIADAAQALGGMDANALKQGIGSIALLMGLISVLSIVSKGNSMLSLATGMIILSVALMTLMVPLLAYSKIPWDTFKKGAGMMALLAGGLALIAHIANGTLQGAASLLIMAAAIALLTGPLLALGVAIVPAVLGLLALGAAIAILTVGAVAATALAAGFGVLATTFLSVAAAIAIAGVGFLAMGAGMTLLAGGLLTLSIALPMLGNAIVAFANTIVQNAGTLVQAAGIIIGGIAVAIFTSRGRIALAVVGVIIAVMDVIIAYAPAILDRFKVIGSGILNWIATDMPSMFMSLLEAIVQGMITLGNAIWEMKFHILQAFWNIFKAAGNLVIEAIAGIAEKFGPLGTKLGNFLRSHKFKVDKIFNKSEGSKSGKEWGDGVYSGISDMPDKFGDIASKGGEAFGEKFDGSLDVSKFSDAKEDILGQFKDLPEKAGGIASQTSSKLSDVGGTAKVDTSGAEKSLKSLSRSMSSVSKTSSKSGKSSGDEFIKSLNSAISKGSKSVKSSAEHTASHAANGVRSKRGAFVSAGSYTMGGLINGFNSRMGEVAASARNAAALWNRTYKANKNIKLGSPSKTQFKNGQYTIQGLINGITDLFPSLKKSADHAADLVYTSLSKTAGMVSDLVESDLSLSPLITPVLDRSNVDKGLSAINDSFGARTLSLTGALNNTMGIRAASLQNGGNSDVVSAIGKLRSDIAGMSNTTYNVNGITYDDGSNVSNAVNSLIRAAIIEGRA